MTIKFTIIYAIVDGKYTISLFHNGQLDSCGDTGCSVEPEALIFAKKVAKSKNGTVHYWLKEGKEYPVPSDSDNPGPIPECSVDCQWRKPFNDFALQKNAIRSELASMIASIRCGWNLKKGALGGHPLDYEPCTFTKAA
ncbi:MAG: hypothetical protein J7K84_10725 [Deltaproteobacteria bacterium]|nr:hypothetical protein [Deltaproteobacteria bacterium]